MPLKISNRFHVDQMLNEHRDQIDSLGKMTHQNDWSGAARATCWHSTHPVQVGASGVNVVLRHPRDMRAPSQAIAFRLPKCDEIVGFTARYKKMFGR